MVYIYHVVTTIVESVDVNVTPDKRQIFMENEKILLATIKVSTCSWSQDVLFWEKVVDAQNYH